MLARLPEPQEDLVEFIRMKETKERRNRLLRFGLLFALIISGAGFFAWKNLDLDPESQAPQLRKYQIEEITRSQLLSLFHQDPSPILLEDKTLGRLDTIRSEKEYQLLLSVIHDATLKLPPGDAGSIFAKNQKDSSALEMSGRISKPFTEADLMPSFKGGEAALYRFLSSQIRYPEAALRNKIEGKVFVRFVIQPDGSLTDLKVMKGIGHGCDKEALRVVRLMPAWIPGEIAGRKVPIYSSLAVNFKFL